MILSPQQFEKISRWSLKRKVTYLTIIFLLSGGGIVGTLKISNDGTTNKNLQENQTSINNNVVVPAVLGESNTKDYNGQMVTEEEFNEKDWIIDKKRIEREKDEKDLYNGYFCANDSKNFDSSIILYKEKIPLDSTLKLRYTLKRGKNFAGSVPKLIFAYGDESNFRIFLPEDIENKFIGIEKVNANGTKTLDRIRLVSKIDSSKENIFEIKIKNSNANKASFLYNLKYFPLPDEDDGLEIKQISDSDNFEEYLPWVDPGNVGFKQSVGIGVFNNVCIKITSATWSNDKSQQ